MCVIIIGTYSEEQASVCSACPAGYVCSDPSQAPVVCPTGMYSFVGEVRQLPRPNRGGCGCVCVGVVIGTYSEQASVLSPCAGGNAVTQVKHLWCARLKCTAFVVKVRQ